MSEPATSDADVQHWDAFWQARDKAISQEDVGARDRAPMLYWESFFRQAFDRSPRPRLIDIACGNGAVTEIAMTIAQDMAVNVDAHCLDYSMSAVDELRKRFPEVEGIACDARVAQGLTTATKRAPGTTRREFGRSRALIMTRLHTRDRP